jgi:hypothetical protein
LATTSNLFIDQGSDYGTLVGVNSTTGAPLILTGYTVKSQMRKSYSSSTAYAFNASVHDALNGKIKLTLTAAQSEAIPAGRWLYDVEITQTETGVKRRVVEGIVTITPQITQI